VNGQPRQEIVGYLASIYDTQYAIELPEYRYKFWVSLCEHLDRLQMQGFLDAGTRQAVEDRIARTVRPATREDVEEAATEHARIRAEMMNESA